MYPITNHGQKCSMYSKRFLFLVAIDPGVSSSSDSASSSPPICKTFHSSYHSDGDDSDKILETHPLPLLGKDPIVLFDHSFDLSDIEDGGDLHESPAVKAKKHKTLVKEQGKVIFEAPGKVQVQTQQTKPGKRAS